MMSDTIITISGPGMNINTELYLIQRLLESQGYTISIENNHPPEKNRYVEQELNRLRGLRDKSPEYYKIKIIMDHQPWGG